MQSESAEPGFNRSSRVHQKDTPNQRAARPPSALGYMAVSGCVAALLFFVVWSLLQGSSEEASLTAAFAACVVLIIAAAAREVFIRRAWSRQVLEFDGRLRPESFSGRVPPASSGPLRPKNSPRSNWSHSTALRNVQRLNAEADSAETAESHWEAYRQTQEYLEATDEALRSANLLAEKRVVMRAGQERVRAMRRHHLKAWTRLKVSGIMLEAKHRARLYDKIDIANQALQVLESSLEEYPDDPDLQNSDLAAREFIASSRIHHWIETAERAAFRGQYRRAISRYRDALFYVSREPMDDATRENLAARVQREILALRAKLQNVHAFDEPETTARHNATSNPAREA